MSKKEKERSDAPPCGAEGCFSGAVFEVIPRGRWRNMPITKACKKHSRSMADAYATKTGEKGWADLEMICPPEKPKKAATQKPTAKQAPRAADPSQREARLEERETRLEPNDLPPAEAST